MKKIKKRGRIVETKTGKRGKVYNGEKPIGGKVPVYLEGGGKMLCNPNNLTLKGYFD